MSGAAAATAAGRAWHVAGLVLGLVALLGLVLAALAIGKYPVAPNDLVVILGRRLLGLDIPVPPTAETVVMQVRLPRVAAALAVGASLAAAGATYQGLFRNPLVSPDILGVSSGAGLGAVLGITLSLPSRRSRGSPLPGGSERWPSSTRSASPCGRHDPVLTLVLAGVAVWARCWVRASRC